MFEYFNEWTKQATFTRTVTSKNAAGQTVKTNQTISDGKAFNVGKWADRSFQSNKNDKFFGENVGRFVIPYQGFTVSVTVGTVTTVSSVVPDNTWIATVDGVRYFVEAVDNVADQNEIYVLTVRKEQ